MTVKVGSAYSKDTSFVILHLTPSLITVFMFLNTQILIDGVVKSPKANIDNHKYVDAAIIQIHGKTNKQP
jgi:hypothetical protein